MKQETLKTLTTGLVVIIAIAIICTMIWGIFSLSYATSGNLENRKYELKAAEINSKLISKDKEFSKDSAYFANGYVLEHLPCGEGYRWVRKPKEKRDD